MKIHRIEATNLNSLYDTQQVDLDTELQGAGLFLVQGPTGAGKSTLLDAVSLALFGSTPRLEGIGNDQAVADQVMSRGTGRAQAVVEFSTRTDGVRRRYRATWSARRAHLRPHGAMQPVARSLELQESDGGWRTLADDHRRKFVQPAFDTVLDGFTARDFQRSMLLAQGRFDAMLHAAPEERATILERLTDTSVYKTIGERAARMRTAWEARLQELRSRRDAVVPVSDAELAAAGAAAESARSRLGVVAARVLNLGAVRDWLQRRETLRADVAAAELEAARAATEAEAAAPELDALREAERCADAFVRLAEVEELDRRVVEVEAELRAVSDGLPAALGRAVDANAAADRAVQAHHTAEHALADLRLPVGRAEQARGAFDEAKRERDAADRAARQADEAVGGAEQGVERAVRALEDAQRARALAQAEVAACAGDAALVQAMPALTEAAARNREAAAAFDRDEGELTRRTDAQAVARTALEAARGRLAGQRDADLRARTTELDRASHALPEPDPDAAIAALAQAEAAGQERLLRLADVVRGVQARDTARARLAEATGAAESAARSLAEAVAAVGGAEADAVETGRLEALAAAVLPPLERIAARAEDRRALLDGDPCPLCGSLDHPYRHDGAQRAQAEAVDDELRRARESLRSASAAHVAASRRLQDTRERAAGLHAAREAAEAVRRRAAAERDAAEQGADGVLGSVGLPADTTAEALSRVQADAAAALAADRLRRADLDTRLAARRHAEAGLAEAVRAWAAEETRLDVEAARLGQADQELAARREALGRAQEQLTHRDEALRAQLTHLGLREARLDDALAAAAARVEHHLRAGAALERAEGATTQAETRRAGAAELLERARAAQVEARANRERREDTQKRRHEVLLAAGAEVAAAWRVATASDRGGVTRPEAGAPPNVLLRSQEQVVRALADAAGLAQKAAAAAAAGHQAEQAKASLLREQLSRLTDARAAAAVRLAEAQTTLGLGDVAALVERRLPPARIETALRLRDTVEHARTRARANLDAARLHLTRHDAARPELPPEAFDPASLGAALAAAASERERLDAELAGAQALLRLADEKSAQLQAAKSALSRAEADARVWLRLHDLIGVREGLRFKLYAQAMNLDHLLSRANRHLARLNPRYRLRGELDPDSGDPTLDFVVEDSWRPGSTRSLRTLSGGESFLVSLALALGLSDLRTTSMPVETLLLDEGFSALDPQSLDTAVAALQALQASGRQVGIISHVGELQERIDARVLVEPQGEGRSRVRTEVGRR